MYPYIVVISFVIVGLTWLFWPISDDKTKEQLKTVPEYKWNIRLAHFGGILVVVALVAGIVYFSGSAVYNSVVYEHQQYDNGIRVALANQIFSAMKAEQGSPSCPTPTDGKIVSREFGYIPTWSGSVMIDVDPGQEQVAIEEGAVIRVSTSTDCVAAFNDGEASMFSAVEKQFPDAYYSQDDGDGWTSQVHLPQ